MRIHIHVYVHNTLFGRYRHTHTDTHRHTEPQYSHGDVHTTQVGVSIGPFVVSIAASVTAAYLADLAVERGVGTHAHTTFALAQCI